MNLKQQLIGFEGWKNHAYPDPLTHGAPWTIGVGHTGPEVVEGLVWSDDKVDQTLDEDIAKATSECKAWVWFEALNEPRQAVLIGMCFQLGFHGLSQFHHMLDACMDLDFEEASKQMLDSLWARQTPKRAARLADQLRTGEWQ